MNPRIKKLIIIVNVIAYIAIAAGIYVRKKGGIKEFMPHKKYTMQEKLAMTKTGQVPPGMKEARLPSQLKKQLAQAGSAPAAAVKTQKPAQKQVPLAVVAAQQMPDSIPATKKMLIAIEMKERAMEYNYSSGGHRDPLTPIIGLTAYLNNTKLSPDDLADISGIPQSQIKKASPFTLTGTIKSKNGESSVVINDRILSVGDIIDGYRVNSIDRRKVILVSGGRTIKLEIPIDSSQTETAILDELEEAEK